MWGGSPRHDREQTQTNNNKEEREGPQRRETNCTLHSSERTQNTQKKETEGTTNQEKTRFPSTALLAQDTRAKTVLILECRETLGLPRQPADDVAVAARLALDEKM